MSKVLLELLDWIFLWYFINLISSIVVDFEALLNRKTKKNIRKHKQWWENYHKKKQDVYDWLHLPTSVLITRNKLETIIGALGFTSQSYIYDGNKMVIAVVQIDKNHSLTFKLNKNSNDLFMFYDLIKKDKTTSRIADFRTKIGNNQEKTVSAIKILLKWLNEQKLKESK